MTEHTDYTVPRGLADLPLDVRRALDADRDRAIREGVASRHAALAADERAYAAAETARGLHHARLAIAKLRGG